MYLTEQSLSEFGRTLGLANLSWDASHQATLQFEHSGTLGFLLGARAVQISLARSYPFITLAQVTAALELCHWQNQFPSSVRMGLTRDNQLVFVTELAHPEFIVSHIHRTLELLSRFHEEVLAK